MSGVINPPFDSVAQLVEQLTLNQRAESSSLSGVTYNYKVFHQKNHLIWTGAKFSFFTFYSRSVQPF
jgi:hypothetical protein